MNYKIITDSNDRVLYISLHVDAVAYKHIQIPGNKIHTLEDDQMPLDLAMWRYEHTTYSELSGLAEDDVRISQELDNVREIRDDELSKTDWITIKHLETKQDLPDEYTTYREWLRDLPETYDTKKVLTSPITVVTGSWMNSSIVEELQPWVYIKDLSGNDEEYTPPIAPRADTTIPVSAFDDVYEQMVVTDTESLLTSINRSVTSVHEPDEAQSSAITYKNIVNFQPDDTQSVEIYTRTWGLSS